MQCPQCPEQIEVCQFDVNLGFHQRGVGREPCRLCLEYVGDGDDTLLHAEVGDAQVLVGLFLRAQGGGQTLTSLL